VALRASVRFDSKENFVLIDRISQECEELKKDIKRLGAQNGEGKFVVKFGVLFDDDK